MCCCPSKACCCCTLVILVLIAVGIVFGFGVYTRGFHKLSNGIHLHISFDLLTCNGSSKSMSKGMSNVAYTITSCSM
jgi:hypothetical protein